MIREVSERDIAECVRVIRSGFLTVAEDLNFTAENAPRFTAFATTEDRLKRQLLNEHRPMYAFYDNGKIVGYYSLHLQENRECELNNLCVLSEYRHKGIGEALLRHAIATSEKRNCVKINIGIVEENRVLRKWYESFGFVHIGTKKFDFFPFTCGYMEKKIEHTEIHNEVKAFCDARKLLSTFTPEEAIRYLTENTGLPEAECSEAYDILMKIDADKMIL